MDECGLIRRVVCPRVGAMAVLAVAVVSVFASKAVAGPASCVIGCSHVGLPVVSAPSISVTGVQDVTLSATVNPDGSSTTYEFSYSQPDESSVQETQQTLATGTATDAVSWAVTGLIPGQTYSASIAAQNASGMAAGGPQSFTMPLDSATPITLKLRHGSFVVSGYDPGIIAKVSGANPAAGLALQVATKASGPFRTVSQGSIDLSGLVENPPATNITWSVGPGTEESPDDLGVFTHNSYLRLESTGTDAYGTQNQSRGTSVSNVVPVYTYPVGNLEVTNVLTPAELPTGRYQAEISFGNSDGPGRAAPPIPTVYLYRRAGPGWRRILRVPHTPSRAWYVTFKAKTFQETATYMVCLPHALSPTLGKPFRFSGCGRATLPGTAGPRGSEYVFDSALSASDTPGPNGAYHF
jgi:hypothetical protein